jgi:hypothetical protein
VEKGIKTIKEAREHIRKASARGYAKERKGCFEDAFGRRAFAF